LGTKNSFKLNINKSPLSSVLVIIAMILITISRLKDNGSMDWLCYAAIAVLIANVLKLIFIDKKSK
tara:strand:+ start:1581 stop:1778 length:198 start_codon:yes stop_codon:yes gene_type:complete